MEITELFESTFFPSEPKRFLTATKTYSDNVENQDNTVAIIYFKLTEKGVI